MENSTTVFSVPVRAAVTGLRLCPYCRKEVKKLHELSLMEGIIDIAVKTARENRMQRIKIIKLCVGEMTAAFPAALRAAFAVLGTDPLFADAVLDIEEVPVTAACRECGHNFRPAAYRFVCPACAAVNVDITSGRELYIDYIEGTEK